VSAAIQVRYADSARKNLYSLIDVLLDRAQTAKGFAAAPQAIDVIRNTAAHTLSRAPFICRKAGDSPTFFVRADVNWCRRLYRVVRD
jgi:hypothetical protein